MKPYPFRGQPAQNRVFNYRLSRARNVSENFFGLICSRFRVLRTQILLNPEKSRQIVKAICALHNFLLEENSSNSMYAPPGTFDSQDLQSQSEWRRDTGTEPIPLEPSNVRNSPQSAKDVRNEFTDYFVSTEGEVEWQYKHL